MCEKPLPYILESFIFLAVSKTIKMKITLLPVVVFWRETWSLTPVWKHRLRVFESRMLRENIGTQVDEVAGS
jgi:hypothetical protein